MGLNVPYRVPDDSPIPGKLTQTDGGRGGSLGSQIVLDESVDDLRVNVGLTSAFAEPSLVGRVNFEKPEASAFDRKGHGEELSPF